jgi:leucyl-tRNA synthetase
MSKSRGNVVDPDRQVATYGADTVRAYLMFGYRWAEGGPWDPDNIQGVVRWLNRVWTLVLETGSARAPNGDPAAEQALLRKAHLAIRQVTHDLEHFEFNTVVSALMELTNSLITAREQGLAGTGAYREAVKTLVSLMAPVTPHIAEELWARLGKPYSIHQQPWQPYDPDLIREEQITLVVQVNGKLRDRIQVAAGIAEQDARQAALASEAVQRYLGDRQPKQVIYVPGRLVNIVV